MGYPSRDVRPLHPYVCKHSDYGRLKLDRMAVELERRYGLRPDRHRWNEREGIEAARQGMVTRLQRGLAQELQTARSWEEAHDLANRHGVRLQPVGASGLRVVQDDGVSAAASAVHTACRR